MIGFRFQPFSKRQKLVLSWWMDGSPYRDCDGIIADGAVRSGKTMSMSLSFVMWAMSTFNGNQFGLCGKSIGSLRRNVINDLKRMLPGRGYAVTDRRGDNVLVIQRGSVENRFYMFGGKDESSQDLIQGVTLAGILLDEVVLMPESFVNQATSRCSVEGAKLWFNCNPDNRMHYFNQQWILQNKAKNLLYLHFTMADNLSLSEATKARYRNMYAGMFFRRYILGEWISADGVIYDMWTDENLFGDDELARLDTVKCVHYIACDYGTTNPMVFLDAYDDGDTYWIVGEYYYDSRRQQRQKTDGEYAADFDRFTGGDKSVTVILDPSAESFRIELKNRGYRVKEADNSVLDGIRLTSSLIQKRKLRVHESCVRLREEIEAYVWDSKAAERGEEKPVKVGDHAMDSMRYLIKTTLRRWRVSQ